MQKIDFTNLPDTTTPINAANLNKLQENIDDAITIYAEEVGEINEATGEITYYSVASSLSDEADGEESI